MSSQPLQRGWSVSGETQTRLGSAGCSDRDSTPGLERFSEEGRCRVCPI